MTARCTLGELYGEGAMSQIGFIGGSGIYQIDSVNVIKTHHIKTPFGESSTAVNECEYKDRKFFFLPRHGDGHRIPPSDINYRANVFALKTLGVRYLISVSAVGSLKEELPPRKIVLPTQFIDWTKGIRKRSFFDKDIVGHISCAYPVEKALSQKSMKYATL